MRTPNSYSKTLIAASVAAAFGVSAGATFAQTTTSHNAADEAAADSVAARHVSLNYPAARNLRICNLSGQAPSATESLNAAEQRSPETRQNLGIEGSQTSTTPVALQVSYAGTSEQIQPGNCYEFQARDVRLSTAQRLPVGSALNISVARMSGSRFVNGRTEAASVSDRDTRQSVKELKEQLKQEDVEERQANAELTQAREKLAQTTRDLKQAESNESHVASAEHRTTQAERQEQQKAQQAPQNGAAPE